MIQAKNIYKSFGPKIIAQNVTFSINKGQRIGLIGPNGAGKSTLLKILLGSEPLDKGEVIRSGRIGFLPQSLSFSEEDTVADYLRPAIQEEWQEYLMPWALAEVTLETEPGARIANLSGGQKTKLGIARLLIEQSEVIFLDEPTNNLDFVALQWLEKFLAKFSGSILVISHDRTFLDNTVNKIFELDTFTHLINEYAGNYTDYVKERLNRRAKQLAAHADFDERRRELEEWISLEKQKQTQHPDPKGGRRLNAMKTKYERFMENDKVDKPQDLQKIRLTNLAEETHGKKAIFYLENVTVPNLFNIAKLTVQGGDRIHLEGANGTGKTTLIKLLMGQIKNYAGIVETGESVKVGYFSQEHEMLNFQNTVMQEMLSQTNVGSETKARQIVGKFAVRGASVFNPVASLSQGERVKLILAILTNQGNNFLILDEPTNHLDLESREILEQALADFLGGFLVVSHDRYFINQIGINRQLLIKNHHIVDRLV